MSWPIKDHLLQDETYRQQIRDYTEEAVRYGRELGKPDLLAGALLNAGLAAWPADHATGFARYDEALSVIRGLIAEPGGLATYGPTFINWVSWPIKDHLLQDETYQQQLEAFQAEATAIANRLSND